MRGWNLGSLDFEQAYLNAALLEMWLELSDGNIVKALNAIYGLKQSALELYKELRNYVLNRELKISESDECLYYCRAEDGRIAVLVTFVDDIHLKRDHEEEIRGMVNHLLKRDGGRDLGVPDKVIGVALMITGKGAKLDQAPYTKRIVIEGMGSCRYVQSFHTSRPGDRSITQARERARTGQLKFSLCKSFGEAHVPGENDKTRVRRERGNRVEVRVHEGANCAHLHEEVADAIGSEAR